MFPSLDEMLSGNFDRIKFLENAAYLRRFFLDCYLSNKKILNIPNQFIYRVYLIHELFKKHGDDAFLIAKELYSQNSCMELYDKKYGVFNAEEVKTESSKSKPRADSLGVNHHNVEDEIALVVNGIITYSNQKDFETFAQWLDEVFLDAGARFKALEKSGFIDQDYYLKTYPDLARHKVQPNHHYSVHGIVEGRSPNSYLKHGMTMDQVLDFILEWAEKIYAGQLVINSYPLTDDESKFREKQLKAIDKSLANSTNTVAVVLHLYYVNSVQSVLDGLKCIPQDFDLLVSVPNWGNDEILKQVKAQYPKAIFYKVENRGRDIAPFLDLLPILIKKNYLAVLKLHTKNSLIHDAKNVADYAQLLMKENITTLLGSPERISGILDAFKMNERLNMVGVSQLYSSLKRYPYPDDGKLLKKLLGDEIPVDEGGYFMGAMFWIRPVSLKPILDKSQLTISSFAPEVNNPQSTLSHIVLRLFSQVAGFDGGKVAGIDADADLSQKKLLNYRLSPNPVSYMKYFELKKMKLVNEQRESLRLSFVAN